MTMRRVSELVAEGVLRVEDGNHGEYRPRPSEFVPEGVPFIRAADMSSNVIDFRSAGKIDTTARARIRKGIGLPGDALLSHKGTVGKVAVAPAGSPDFVCSPQTTFWRSLDSTQLEQRFLPYVMKSPNFVTQLHYLMGQTDMAPYVSLTDQRSMTIHLPTIQEQTAIAEVLGALDDKIGANAQVLASLEDLMVAMYLESLDTDARQMLVGTVATFHNRKRVPLSAQQRDQRVGSVPYYGATGVFGYVDQALFDERLVLVGEDGSVVQANGRPVVQYIWGPAWVNNHAHVLTGVGLSTEVLRLAVGRANVLSIVTGAVQPKISMGNLKALMLDIPGRRQLSALEPQIDSLSAVSRAKTEESRTLVATRDTMLPLLMSGLIRAGDVQSVVEGTF